MDLTLKPPEREHLGEIIVLLQTISEFIPAEGRLNDLWIQYSGQSDSSSVVALADAMVVGFASIFFATRIRGGKVGYIEDVAVHPDYRNLGIGRQLLNFLSQTARVEGCFKVSLRCSSENVGFYQNNGFNESAVSLQKRLASL